MEYLRTEGTVAIDRRMSPTYSRSTYHWKANLWLDDKYDIVSLTDDISCDLNAAMTGRSRSNADPHCSNR